MFKDKLRRESLYLVKLHNRNEKILNSRERKPRENIVNLHWWSPQRSDKMENVGDYLSKVVCSFMLEKKGMTFEDKVEKTAHLYAIGSIIQGGAQNAVIWGSGLKHGADDISILMRFTRKLDIRLVRGPDTRKILISKGYECPEIYGDPAVLMPLIYQAEKRVKKDYTIVLHYDSYYNIQESITPMTNDYKEFINQIYNSKLVISSSLHGIILAESYGVPSILLSDKVVTESAFKYYDYYHSTGRYNFPVANSIEEALNTAPPAVPDFTQMRQNIMNTFPYDLWGAKKESHNDNPERKIYDS